MLEQNYNKIMNIEYARELAYRLHEGQTRANGITPYIEHPKKVAELVEKYGGNNDTICVAWLHDIFEESGDRVCEYLKLDKEYKNSEIKMYRKLRDHDEFDGIKWMLLGISDNWKSDQEKIKMCGKLAYLANLLIRAEGPLLRLKLCDMLANMLESKATRMSQETRYYKAIQCLKMAERQDLDDNHIKLINKIETVYILHKYYKDETFGAINGKPALEMIDIKL